MTNKIIIYGGIALALALALVLGVFGLTRKNTVIKETTNPTTTSLGSTVSLDNVDSGYYSIGGMKMFNFTQGVSATTTAFCSSKNPFNATSTVTSISTVFSSTTAWTVTGGGANLSIAYSISTTTNPGASAGSSTPAIVREHTILGGNNGGDTQLWTGGNVGTTTGFAPGQVLGVASSTGESNIVIPPGTSLVWRWSTTTSQLTYTGYTYYPQGICHATWQQL